MPRTACSQPFDPAAAAWQLAELGVKRRQFIKARIRVLNAAGALVRRGLGWNSDLDESESGKISRKAAKIMAAERPDTLPDDLKDVAVALWADIEVARAMAAPGEIHQHQHELEMRRIARQFPVWKAWAKDVKGFSDLGLAIVISEAGLLEKYSNKGKLWRRLGLAPFTKNGETRALSQWRMKGGLSADDWTQAGYSPRRRATIFSQIGSQIIGGMGRGYRPLVGEDIEQNDKLSHYEKVFVRRLRYEAARDETMRRPDTDEGKESYAKACAEKARYYTEKIFIRDLWVAWRRAMSGMPLRAKLDMPSAVNSNAPSGAVSANAPVPKGQLASADTKAAPKGAGRAKIGVLRKAKKPMPAPTLETAG